MTPLTPMAVSDDMSGVTPLMSLVNLEEQAG